VGVLLVLLERWTVGVVLLLLVLTVAAPELLFLVLFVVLAAVMLFPFAELLEFGLVEAVRA